ncbi:MAG: glycoside hydrolase family 71/99-like protein [Bdellovibrionales bacterium]
MSLQSFLFLILFSQFSFAQAPKDFSQLTLVGYQAWFGTPNDQVHKRWNHWGLPERITFELYPDMREYAKEDVYSTGLGKLPNGQDSVLFSSVRDGVMSTHFRWMSEYGIDGVALQRFANELSMNPLHFRNVAAQKVKTHAEKWKRYFYLTYDLSGANPKTLVDDIQRDWVNLEARLRLTASSYYVKSGGKPVIGLWGFGFEDRPVQPHQALQLIQFFRQKGFAVLGGAPWWWRKITAWHQVYFSVQILQPWAVGSYRNERDLQSMHDTIYWEDIRLLKQHGVQYQRVIFPGFAWSNWNGGEKNMIPRSAGRFMWNQALEVKSLGVSSMIAMFDEYDEGTAIAKAAENKSFLPVGKYFLTLAEDGQDMSSDFYLRLSGMITKLFRGEIKPQPTVPVPLRP